MGHLDVNTTATRERIEIIMKGIQYINRGDDV